MGICAVTWATWEVLQFVTRRTLLDRARRGVAPARRAVSPESEGGNRSLEERHIRYVKLARYVRIPESVGCRLTANSKGGIAGSDLGVRALVWRPGAQDRTVVEHQAASAARRGFEVAVSVPPLTVCA